MAQGCGHGGGGEKQLSPPLTSVGGGGVMGRGERVREWPVAALETGGTGPFGPLDVGRLALSSPLSLTLHLTGPCVGSNGTQRRCVVCPKEQPCGILMHRCLDDYDRFILYPLKRGS